MQIKREDSFGLESMRTEQFKNSALRAKHKMRGCYYFCMAVYDFFMVRIQSVLCTKNSSWESTVNNCFPSSPKNLWRDCYHSLRAFLEGLVYQEKHCFCFPSLIQLWEKTKLIKHTFSALRQMSVYLGSSKQRRKDLSPSPH